jgi:molecular chaperone DnaK
VQLSSALPIEVHFDFDINGILTVTATEKGKGNQGSLVVNNASVHRLSSHDLAQAQAELDALFIDADDVEAMEAGLNQLIEVATTVVGAVSPEVSALQKRAETTLASLEDPDEAAELEDLIGQLSRAMEGEGAIAQAQEELEDFLYYVNQNN